MSTDHDLRAALRGDDAVGSTPASNVPATRTATTIDANVVVRRARARRLPRQVIVGSASALAVAGIVVLGVTTLPALQQSSTVAGAAADLATAPNDAGIMGSGMPENGNSKSGVPSPYNLCGMPTTDPAPNPTTLSVTVEFPSTITPGTAAVTGTTTITNTGQTRVVGATPAEPFITVSRDGVTVWHTDQARPLDTTSTASPMGPPTDAAARSIDLAPGASVSYPASFTPVECTAADDGESGFRDNLPALQPGTYEVSAMILFTPETTDDVGAPPEPVFLTGPALSIELR